MLGNPDSYQTISMHEEGETGHALESYHVRFQYKGNNRKIEGMATCLYDNNDDHASAYIPG